MASIDSLPCFKPDQAFIRSSNFNASNFNAVTLSFNGKSFPRFAPLRLQDSCAVLFVTNNNRHALKVYSSESESALTYTEDASKSHNDVLGKPGSSTSGEKIAEPVQHIVSEPKRAAKIHDFCFGIPYGMIVFSGGLVGFIFSRNPATLITGGLYGGALLALSVLSLKIWRQGHSSVLFILGQAGLAAALVWKNMQTYSLTKKILPTGFYAVISAAMLCFYTYVVLSGGNPPPKKQLNSTAASPL